MQQKRNDIMLIWAQVLLWICAILFLTVAIFSISGTGRSFLSIFKSLTLSILPVMLLYFLNYFLLVPKLLFRKKWPYFLLANLGGYGLLNLRTFYAPIPAQVAETFRYARFTALFSHFIIDLLVVLAAIGVRYIKRFNDTRAAMQEQKQKTAEAELNWLKYQLNPHFLFNTLNNISSLTQINPDEAQEKIGQLSDILRYALYDSDREFVPLAGEIEFMDNYIDLMALRCNDLARVEKRLGDFPPSVEIAPLLFISLIENAFKHGINARKESFVRVGLHAEGKDLVFSCENSRFGQPGAERIGSGIGLENLQRRLDLLYPGRYKYSYEAGEGTWRTTVRLKNLLP